MTRGMAVRVAGRSMLPFLPPGSVLRLERPLPPGSLFGRVALVPLRGRLVLHRVIRDAGRFVVTRGDASCVTDPPLPRGLIRGLAWGVLASPAGAFARLAVACPRLAGAFALALHPFVRCAARLDELVHLVRGR